MKKGLITIVVLVTFMVGAVSVFAADSVPPFGGMMDKLWRGIVNITTGWIEFPAQISKGYETGGIMGENNKGALGAFGGVFSGIGSALGRTLSGAGQVAGFWAADPISNDGVGIPLDADFAWEEGTQYNMTDPSFTAATLEPISLKFQRAIGNLFGGVLELPSQIIKGIKAPAWDLGIVKGLWFFASREIDGAMELCTFALPGPRENQGYPFDEKWAWTVMTEGTESTGSTGSSVSTVSTK